MERPRVLVVEDNPGVLRLMATILEQSYQVTTAPDGKAALSLIGSQPFDVVLADVKMPGLGGFDVLKAVQGRCPATQTVMMTGYASVPDAVSAIKFGAFDYVAKPLDSDEILLVVARAVERLREIQQSGAGIETDKPRVLVVEDDPDALSTMVSILEGSYQVSTASDGETALGLIDSAPTDVLLADIRMPGLSGFDVLKAVQDRAPSTAVVMMTGHASVPDAVRAMKLGAFEYIEKPFDPDEISLAVIRALEHKRALERQSGADPRPGGGDPHGNPDQPVSSEFRSAIEEARERASRDYLERLMRSFRGNVTNASRRAGMTRESLHRVLRKYGVRSGQYKDDGAESESLLPEVGAK
ncbi:MAG TPA: response regulator [Anaeromyxobacteraceae bacterium]|nr:response regulator [Anaeromyxobacteraceae bacterium]